MPCCAGACRPRPRCRPASRTCITRSASRRRSPPSAPRGGPSPASTTPASATTASAATRPRPPCRRECLMQFWPVTARRHCPASRCEAASAPTTPRPWPVQVCGVAVQGPGQLHLPAGAGGARQRLRQRNRGPGVCVPVRGGTGGPFDAAYDQGVGSGLDASPCLGCVCVCAAASSPTTPSAPQSLRPR